MNKQIPSIILLFAVVLALLVYGCGSGSGNGVSVDLTDDYDITSSEGTVDNLGRLLPAITFPSGTTITGSEENTLKPKVIVTVVEKTPK